jgi:hypothetical protein
MKKTIYIILTLIVVGFLGYTLYYTTTHKANIEPTLTIVATTTIATTTVDSVPAKNILTTKTGKTITIRETNPSGESLSTITITSKGLTNDQPIVLEKNKLTDFFLTDMNNDGFDELVIVTTAQGSGSYGEVDIFTTVDDKALLKVDTPSVTEDDTKKGALFEGYMGHDLFMVASGTLMRQFPLYTASSTNSTPTGQTKTIFYSLNGTSSVFSVTLSPTKKLLPQVPTNTPLMKGTTSPSITSTATPPPTAAPK